MCSKFFCSSALFDRSLNLQNSELPSDTGSRLHIASTRSNTIRKPKVSSSLLRVEMNSVMKTSNSLADLISFMRKTRLPDLCSSLEKVQRNSVNWCPHISHLFRNEGE